MKASELRQSILQAAVQGKLVPQNLHDEPAEHLLDRIKKERTRLLEADYPNTEEAKVQIKKQNKQYIPNDVDDLPDGWVWSTLMGCSLLVVDCHNKTAPYTSSGIPLIRTSNIRNGKVVYNDLRYVNHDTYKKWSSRCLPEPADILITREAPMGEVCMIPPDAVFCLGQRIMLIRLLPDTIVREYLYYFLQNPNLMEYIQDKPVGLTVKHLRVGGVETMLIPIPPRSEQQRIVAKVEELMALCDQLEAVENELETLETHFIEYLPKSILQMAVQGKLVPQNLHDEPATELLERIRAEKAKLVKEGKLKKEKPLPPITEDEIPYDLPEGWVWYRLGEACIVNPRNQLPDDLDVAFTPMPLISSDYFGGHEQEIRKWGKVKSGFTHYAEDDVVLAKITPCFQNGKSCIMKNLTNGFGAGTTELHVLRCIEIVQEYLLIYLKSPSFLTDGERNMTGTAGQQRVPTDYLKSCLLPVPPYAEQLRIVSKVNELMTLCNEVRMAKTMPIKTIESNVVPFPQNAAPEEIDIAARGDAEGLPQEALDDLAELFGDGKND